MFWKIAARLSIVLTFFVLADQAAQADELSARARPSGDIIVDAVWRGIDIQIPLSQPVPWRTRLMADPPRAVVDFRTVDWRGVDVRDIALEGAVTAVRVGDAGGGWSRIVFELSRTMGFAEAGMATDVETGEALLTLGLVAVSEEEFAQQAEALMAAVSREATQSTAPRPPFGQRPTIVVLDPGHGGVDPGAIHHGVTEARIMLTFARELAEAMRRTGRYDVVMTRNADTFVSLDARITVAHGAEADLFLSLHADALEGPQATGATVYTLSEEASDEASATLAERHDRDDLLGAGVDLSGTEDAVADVLMDLARARTSPATDRLARALVTAIRANDLRMHRHPWQQAAFSVLRSPSVPSVLIEVGFLSSDRDRARLTDRAWRARMIDAIIEGVDAWGTEEATQRALSRP